MSAYLNRERNWNDRHPMCDCPRSPTFPWQIQVLDGCMGGKIAHPSQLTNADIKMYIDHLKRSLHGGKADVG